MSQIKTLGDYLQWASDYFVASNLYFGHGTDNAWDEAVMIALHVLQLPPDVDDQVLNLTLTHPQLLKMQDLAEQRVHKRIPVPYLTNEAWFGRERYYVNQDVIIPRSPLAELIDQHFQPWLGKLQPQRILDLCTGSGCIAIHCGKQFPDAIIDASDISPLALRVARKNVQLHKTKVNLYLSDLFAGLPKVKYDLIISNPPYVSSAEMLNLPREYQHEPKLALVSGEDGLTITERILREASRHLQPHGLLIVEVGNSWEMLVDKYPNLPFTWLEFTQGGEGVFLLRAEDLC